LLGGGKEQRLGNSNGLKWVYAVEPKSLKKASSKRCRSNFGFPSLAFPGPVRNKAMGLVTLFGWAAVPDPVDQMIQLPT
jgi:hypothetical protein